MFTTTEPIPYGTGTLTNIPILAGETINKNINLDIAGTPVNLTGYTIKMQVAFPTPLFLSTVDGSITLTGTSSFNILIADTTTEATDIGSYPYDIFIIDPSGYSLAILQGFITICQAVTPIP